MLLLERDSYQQGKSAAKEETAKGISHRQRNWRLRGDVPPERARGEGRERKSILALVARRTFYSLGTHTDSLPILCFGSSVFGSPAAAGLLIPCLFVLTVSVLLLVDNSSRSLSTSHLSLSSWHHRLITVYVGAGVF